jgi:hypothetical protein
MDREADRREVGLLDHGRDEWSEQAFHHGVNDVAERLRSPRRRRDQSRCPGARIV